MKINVLGFNQEEIMNIATDNEIRLNVTDLLVLRTIVDMIESNRLETKVIDGKVYTWVNYNLLLEDLPMVATSIETIKKIVSKLVKCGLLNRKVKKQVNGGAFTYFKTTVKLEDIKYKAIQEPVETTSVKQEQKETSIDEKKQYTVETKSMVEDDIFVVNEESAKSYAIGMVNESMTENLTKNTAYNIDKLSYDEISILISRLNKVLNNQRDEGKKTFVNNSFVNLKVEDLIKEREKSNKKI